MPGHAERPAFPALRIGTAPASQRWERGRRLRPSRPRLSLRTALFGLAVLWLTGCAVLCREGGTGAPGAIPEARQDYLEACASCHGSGGTGDGPAAPALAVPPSDLTLLARRHGGKFPRARVLAMLAGELPIPAHGSREMPVWSQRFDAQSGGTAAASIYARRRLEMLARYLESLQRSSHGKR